VLLRWEGCDGKMVRILVEDEVHAPSLHAPLASVTPRTCVSCGWQGGGDTVIARALPGQPGKVVIDSIEGDKVCVCKPTAVSVVLNLPPYPGLWDFRSDLTTDLCYHYSVDNRVVCPGIPTRTASALQLKRHSN
jgi:hypothetical protein